MVSTAQGHKWQIKQPNGIGSKMIWLRFWLKAVVGKISGADKKTAPLIWKPL